MLRLTRLRRIQDLSPVEGTALAYAGIKTYEKKAPKTPVSVFEETPGKETRRIRTRPRRRDNTSIVEWLKRSVRWETKVVPFGKYIRPPTFDPVTLCNPGTDFIDLECLPDAFEWTNPFTKATERIDFSILPSTDPNNMSKEAKALRWTEENVPLRDEDLPIALRNPKTRDEILSKALAPNARPKDIMKIWSGREPKANDLDPWIMEQYKKLPNIKGIKGDLLRLMSHPRTLRAAAEYLRVMYPSEVPEHYPPRFFENLSEELMTGRWKADAVIPDPPNPYRMEDYDVNENESRPLKVDKDSDVVITETSVPVTDPRLWKTNSKGEREEELTSIGHRLRKRAGPWAVD